MPPNKINNIAFFILNVNPSFCWNAIQRDLSFLGNLQLLQTLHYSETVDLLINLNDCTTMQAQHVLHELDENGTFDFLAKSGTFYAMIYQ